MKVLCEPVRILRLAAICLLAGLLGGFVLGVQVNPLDQPVNIESVTGLEQRAEAR